MAAPFKPDPGDVFASDAHRRVLGHLGRSAREGYTPEELLERIHPDEHTPLEAPGDLAALRELLTSLEEDGHAKESKTGWHMTPAGFKAITGPNGENAP